jgi:hypothetical protein
MTEKQNKIVLTIKQKLVLIAKLKKGKDNTKVLKTMAQGYKPYLT